MPRRPKEVMQGVVATFRGRLDTHKIHSTDDLYHFRLRFKSSCPSGPWGTGTRYRVSVVPIDIPSGPNHFYFLCEEVEVARTGRKPKGVYTVQSEKEGKWVAMQMSAGLYTKDFRMYAGMVRPTGKLHSVSVLVDIMDTGALRVQRPDIVRTPANKDLAPGLSVLDPKRGRQSAVLALPPPDNSDTVEVEVMPAAFTVEEEEPKRRHKLKTRISKPDGTIIEVYNDGTKVEHFPDSDPDAGESDDIV